MDLPDSVYKLPHLSVLEISHCTKLKIGRSLTCHSFGSLSEYGFLKLEYLNLNNCENLTELDLLMMPDYFPELKYLYLDGTNIRMIPESISRFARLRRLGIKNCMQLCKIPRLPQSIRTVCATNCKSLNSQSLSSLLSQAQEILGISPVKFFKAQEVTYQLIRGHQTDYHIGLFSLPYSLMSLHLKLNALYLKMRTLIVNLFYLELIFQSGSTITVLDIPYHFGLVLDFQNLLSVLLLDRRH